MPRSGTEAAPHYVRALAHAAAQDATNLRFPDDDTTEASWVIGEALHREIAKQA